LLSNQRIIHDNNATLIDLSVALNDITTGNATIDIVAAQDKLYIGSDLPFNHRHFQVAVANTAVAAIGTIEIWNGNEWVAAVDVVDQTSVAGKTMAQSGIVSWTVARNASWGREDTTEDIPTLATLKIYDFYWSRLTFSANLSATTALSYVGHRFANDDNLSPMYPELMRAEILDAFKTGKTDWNEQHLLAAEEIIQDIRQKKIAWNRNQILDWGQFNLAGIHRVAVLIMRAFGDDYRDNRAAAFQDYHKAMNLKVFTIDRNEDGRLDPVERRPNMGIVRT
jgi:hypothetical protein